MSSFPGLRQMRSITQVVGRRTALRYLAVGVGVSILAACSKNRDNSNGPTGPVGQAVSAFVRGKWRVETSFPEAVPLLVEVTANSWTIGRYPQDPLGAQDPPWSGQWALAGSKLAIQGPESPGDKVVQLAALNVPDKIGRSESLRLPWKCSSAPDSDDELRVKYANGTLRITHVTTSPYPTEFTCTRV